jgi:hypothetical protein
MKHGQKWSVLLLRKRSTKNSEAGKTQKKTSLAKLAVLLPMCFPIWETRGPIVAETPDFTGVLDRKRYPKNAAKTAAFNA